MRPFLTLHDPTLANSYYADGLWHDEKFYSLAAGEARERPDVVALIDGQNSWTWAAVCARADASAAHLSAAGLVPGYRVSMWLSNHVAAVIVFLACSRAGFVCNPSLHRTYTDVEVLQLAERLGSAAFVTEGNWGANADTDALIASLRELRYQAVKRLRYE